MNINALDRLWIERAYDHFYNRGRPFPLLERLEVFRTYEKYDFFGALVPEGNARCCATWEVVARMVWRECNPNGMMAA